LGEEEGELSICQLIQQYFKRFDFEISQLFRQYSFSITKKHFSTIEMIAV